MIITITVLDSLINRLKNLTIIDSGGVTNRHVTDAELKLAIVKAVQTYVVQREKAVISATPKADKNTVKKVGKSL